MEIRLTSIELQELKKILNDGDLEKLKVLVSDNIICYCILNKNIKGDDVSTDLMYLADVVKVGDYVAYDAGIWKETREEPTHQGEFGGYTAGTNKGMSLEGKNHGWRVMRVDNSNKIVTLVHAGVPEHYYHEMGCSGESVENLHKRATSEYMNKDYAEWVHMLTLKEIRTLDIDSDLRAIDIFYYLATDIDYEVTSSSYGLLKNVYPNGAISETEEHSIGIRPVIELKPNILTTGKVIDSVGNEAWRLMKVNSYVNLEIMRKLFMKIKLTSIELQELKKILNDEDLEKLKVLVSDNIICDNKNIKGDDVSTDLMYLADVVAVGDYVAYDAGIWKETRGEPTHQGEFGGYTAGTNKGMSLEGKIHGWRVMRVDNSNKIVTLVHAGVPEHYFHKWGYSKESIANLHKRATSEYMNKDYVECVHMLTNAEIETLDRKSDLRAINRAIDILYYIPTEGNKGLLDFVEGNGFTYGIGCGRLGHRPAVELYPYIQTTGQTEDIFGNKAWQLVKTIRDKQ